MIFIIKYIRNFEVNNLASKLGFLYLLNITDLIFTLILIQTEYIVEANPLMNSVLSNSLATFLVKLLLPAVLFLYLYVRLQSATLPQLKLSNYFITALMIFYLGINLLHLLWFALMPFFMSL
ncbi:MAG: DUF5658 family protein [Turicibacter sp.]